MFDSWRLRMMSALPSAASISTGSWESRDRGPSIPSSLEKTDSTSPGAASNEKPRSTMSAPRAKQSSTLSRIPGTRWASMISASTFIRDVPPIRTPFMMKEKSEADSAAATRDTASSLPLFARRSSAGVVRERGTPGRSGRT